MSLRILLVTSRPPVPPNNGGRQRSALLMQGLRALGRTDLVLVAIPEKQNTEAMALMEREWNLRGCIAPARDGERMPWKLGRGLAPELVDRLAHNLGHRRHDYEPDEGVARFVRDLHERERYDIVVGRYAGPAGKAAIDRLGVPTLLDIDDLDTTVYRSRLEAGAGGVTGALDRLHLAQMEGFISNVYRRFDHIWVANPADAGRLVHPSVSVLPNVPYAIPDDVGNRREFDAQRIGVVASWTHPANQRGLRRFVTSCWGKVLERSPGATLAVYGGGMDAGLKGLLEGTPGVAVAGFVDKITDAYDQCAFMLAPVYDGAGTKIKVLEALACRRAIVSTAHAYEGFEDDLTPGESIAVGEDDAGMVSRCVELLGDVALRDRIAANGHAVVLERYSERTVRERVAASVARVCGGDA